MNQQLELTCLRTWTISACWTLVFALLLVLSAASAAGQSASSGTVSGQVTDPQGAALAGAEIGLTDPLTGITRTTLTNDAGRFSFISVTPAAYDFLVSKPGFSTSRMAAQKVEVGLTLTLNVALQLGSITTTVEVKAAAGAAFAVLAATNRWTSPTRPP